MKTLMAVVVMLGAMACGTTPKLQCEEQAQVGCKRVYECYSKDELTPLQAQFGTTEAECVTIAKKNFCDTLVDASPCGTTGKKYDAAKAGACIGDIRSASCGDFKAGKVGNNCSAVCG